MAEWKVNWSGNLPALVTPFKADGSLDEESMTLLIDTVIQEGVSGVVVAGHTGEFWLLSDDERRRLVEIAVQAARGRALVIAGTTDVTARRVVDHTRAAREAGADGVMVMSPMHASPTKRDILAYYGQVSEEGGLPILVYNYPEAAGINLTEWLADIADIENVVAVKQSSDSWSELVYTLAAVSDRLRVFSGMASYRAVAAACMGVSGLVSSLDVNIMGREAVQMWGLAVNGELEAARRIQFRAFQLARALHSPAVGNSSAAIKTAMRLRGRPGGTVRPPHLPLTENEEEAVRRVLRGLDLLPEAGRP